MSATTLKSPALAQLHQTRWSATTARSMLAAQAASGETLTAFSRRHGLHPQRLFWWRKQLQEWGSERKAAPQFIPVVATAHATGPEGPPAVGALAPPSLREAAAAIAQVTLHLGEVTLEIADAAAVPPAWLAALVHELRR